MGGAGLQDEKRGRAPQTVPWDLTGDEGEKEGLVASLSTILVVTRS